MRGAVILGCPRSGTTVLRRLLDAHPDLSCSAETQLFSACARFLRRERFEAGLEVGVVPALVAQGLPAELAPDALRVLVLGLLDEVAARRGKARWVEKTAVDVFHLDVLAPFLSGHVRYVGLVRHGLDVVLSLSDLAERTGGVLEELHPYVRRFPRPWVAWAHAWADATTAVLDLAERQPRDVHLVTYERLVASPEAVVGEVLAFLGASGTVDVAEALARPPSPGFGDWKTIPTTRVSAASVGRWRGMSPATRADLAPIVDPVLVRAGYPPVGDDRPVIDGDRRQRLAHLAAGLRGRIVEEGG